MHASGGVLQEDRSTGYVFLRCETPRAAKKLARDPVWRVLRNNEKCQAVSVDDGTIMAAFFAPDNLKNPQKNNLIVDRSCHILIVEDKLLVSDPAHKRGSVRIDWNQRT